MTQRDETRVLTKAGEMLAWLAENGAQTREQIAEHFELETGTVIRYLINFQRLRFVEHFRDGQRVLWRFIASWDIRLVLPKLRVSYAAT